MREIAREKWREREREREKESDIERENSSKNFESSIHSTQKENWQIFGSMNCKKIEKGGK